jgi:glutamate carboxypeptidase
MTPTPHRSALLICMAAWPLLAVAQLDDTERAIVAWSQDHAEDTIALIERQVNINSGTMNPAGVR